MSQVITARLSRVDAQPWGFRLQGGKDFGTPLVIQKVNTGSIADNAGLKAGDAVVRINTTDLYTLRHKDAQDAIVRAGPSFELVVQRGGATWKPSITPIGSAAPSPLPGNYAPVTKTSLAANKQQVSNFGSGHNSAARPFIPASPVRSIGNKQYNTPVAMYSDETIAETLSSQAEVLAGGVLGVNFKKNEKVYNPEKSEVLKALQENDSEPEPAELPAIAQSAPYQQQYQPPTHQAAPTQNVVTKHVHAPIDRPISNNNGGLPAGQNICADCERLIVGVFVRIKDKNLHVECFKCATCGTSLKNQGYFNLHNKLYCDIHARMAALNSPPPSANGLVPVTFPPKNVGASAISSALSAHGGNLNGNCRNNENESLKQAYKSKAIEDNNNNIIYDNRSASSETDCSSLSSSDKENDSRPSSSLYGNINKNESQRKVSGESFQYRTMNGSVIKSVVPPGKGIKVDYKTSSNFSTPKPFSYSPAAPSIGGPPLAAPKSPSTYPPPSQNTWAPPSAGAPIASRPAGPVQEFIDIEKCNGKPREEAPKIREKRVEIYVPSDSEEDFDPQSLVDIAKPPPSNFVWPPPREYENIPIAAPLYVAPPETQRIASKPCSYRQLEKPLQLSVKNLHKVESQQTNSTEYECLNVDSNITATTTSTSNASSESEYKMYQTQNNHYANMFEQTIEVDNEVEEINQKPIIDLRKTPPSLELPKNIKRVEFVEPDPSYKAETFSSVFSNRKETWQKLTSSSFVRHEEKQNDYTEVTDNNPENSKEDQNEEEKQEDDGEDDVEEEIQGQHAGPFEGAYYQLAPSNIPQPTPKGYQSDFQKALITTSERPYQISDVAPTPEPRLPNLDLYEEAVREAQAYPVQEVKSNKPKKDIPQFEVKTTAKQCEFPYYEQDVRKGSLMSSLLSTVSPKPMEFVKSNVIDEVHLPDDIDAYFPPPISMEPHEPYESLESYRTKSPFVGALTTVPDRPYTPFGREIMSQLSMELPEDTRQITFSNALHTVPDDSFNPSSLEYDYDPVEYTAKVYERIAVETEAEETSSTSAFAQFGSSSTTRTFLPTIQPWSTASDQFADNSFTDSISGQESLDCHVSESRRCSEFQSNQRRRSTVVEESDLENRKFGEAPKQLSDLLNRCSRVVEEEEFDPDLPNPSAIYPRRSLQPSPFEGMQVKVTNKLTSSLHKADEIPTYQRKWFNLPTQNPPKTPEPEELRENVPVAFHEWSINSSEWNQQDIVEVKQAKVTNKLTAHLHNAEEVPKWFKPTERPDIDGDLRINHDCPNVSRHNSISSGDQHTALSIAQRHVRTSIAETGMSSKPPIPTELSNSSGLQSRRTSASDSRREGQSFFEEAEDDFDVLNFPTIKIVQVENAFPTRGVRKNSLADLPQRQKFQLDKQRDLRQELQQHQDKMQNKQKVRQQKELEMLRSCSLSSQKAAEDLIREEIQQNRNLSAYEQEMEYKRQLELEKQQRQKERELKEQQARELEYQSKLEESRKHEYLVREKRETEIQQQTQREMEYQKIRDEQDETARRQQEDRDLELRRQQEEVEQEIRHQQEHQKREAEKLEARRLWDIRRKEETERELERLETELRNKREEELRILEQEIREKREQRRREEKAAEQTRIQEQKLREEAAYEQRRLDEIAGKEQNERELKLQQELKLRQKQEADRKQKEEMELFDIEEERQNRESLVTRQKTQQQTKSNMYSSHVYQQQMVWPPTSKPATPAPTPQPRQIPIIKTDSETELNATKFRFEPLDEEQRRFMAGIRPPSTCYSPPTEDKPFPSIPYYQQHLAFYEAEPDHCGIFNPKALSPTPNRSKSPAFGPPPNPLIAFVNKSRDPELDESGIYLCGERLLSPIWYNKKNKQIPPAVQRKIHPLGSSGPPSKPDLSVLKEAVRKHKLESGTKPPPIPPPMPSKLLAQRSKTEEETSELKVESTELPPKATNKESFKATDLLKESIDRLNINTQNSDFRKNASNVIAAMLEARVNKQQPAQTPFKSNKILKKFDDLEFLPPPPPVMLNNNASSLINGTLIEFNSCDQDLPLPPPPSPLKIPASILTPPLSSDENDLPQKVIDKVQNNINNNTEKVNYRNKKQQLNSHSNQSSDLHNAPSTFNINKPELSTHARDRRSYIEKNNEIPTPVNGAVEDDVEVTKIANGLANGENPVCDKCKCKITRGPFITALGKTWCPAHFLCVNPSCKRELVDIGFVEEKGDLYCEYCFEQFLAPPCGKCNGKIKGDCLNAIGKKFHPECFKCTYCGKLFGNSPFFLEEGDAYCEADWNELFTTKCFACGFPVEAGDRWVEALNNNYHSQCFNCTYCKKNLEGQSFFAKGGRPFCKNHAR